MTIKAQIDVVGLGQCSLDILGQLDNYPELDQKAELSALLLQLSLIHISEPTRPPSTSRMPSSA